MEPTIPIDLLWCWTLAVMCVVLGAVTVWWEERHKRSHEDEEE